MINLKSLTKCEMAKIVVSSLYNMKYVCTKLNKVQWKRVKMLMSYNKDEIIYQYQMALEVMLERSERDGKEYIAEWVKQSIEGDKV